MKLHRSSDTTLLLEMLKRGREGLVKLVKSADCSVIEEAFILETVNRIRDIQNSAVLGEE